MYRSEIWSGTTIVQRAPWRQYAELASFFRVALYGLSLAAPFSYVEQRVQLELILRFATLRITNSMPFRNK